MEGAPMDPTEKRIKQRPVSPVPSCVSMKSDRSMDAPGSVFRDLPTESGIKQRPVSPVPTCVSMKSDRSMDVPGSVFRDLPTESGIKQRPVSPEPSYMSMKSDRSMDVPGSMFRDLPTESGIEMQTRSACSGHASNASMEAPYNFKATRVALETRSESCGSAAASDHSMEPPILFKGTGVTLGTRSASSDRSMGPPNFKGTGVDIEKRSASSGYASASDHSMEPPIRFKETGSVVLCDICSEIDADVVKRAVKTCQNCSSSYCEKHVKKHYTELRYQTHRLVDVPGRPEQRVCQDHLRPLEVFCSTDQILICSQCSVTKHQGHVIHHQTETPGGKFTTFDGKNSTTLTSFVLPPPGEICFFSVKSDSVTVKWGPPEGLEGPNTFIVTWECSWEKKSLKVTDTSQVVINGLQPGQRYGFSVTTEDKHGNRSNPVSASKHTVLPPPRDFNVVRSGATSSVLHWSKAKGMERLLHYFLISYHSPGTKLLTVFTEDCNRTLTDLKPGTEYTVKVYTVLKNGEQSEPVSTTFWTRVPAPADLTTEQVQSSSVTLRWTKPEGLGQQISHHFLISYSSPGTEAQTTQTEDCYTTLTDLLPAEYTVSVSTVLDHGPQSEPVSRTINTRVPAPADLTTEQVQSLSVTLRWTKAEGLGQQIPHHFLVSYSSPGTEAQTTQTEDCYTTLTDLQPAEYTVSVSTVLDHGEQSEPVSTTINMSSDELRIVVIGKTGAGKSSALNTILGKEAFKNKCSETAQTQVCSRDEGFVCGRRVTVIDTPGIFDHERPEEDLRKELVSCLTQCAPGPHAFLLAVKMERCTPESMATMKKIQKRFGKDVLERMVVLFTHGDELEETQTIHDFLAESDKINKMGNFKSLVQKCGNRVHVVDNKHWSKSMCDEYRNNKFQISELMATIDTMMKQNGGGHYTNKVLEILGEAIEAEVKQIQKEMEEAGETAEMSEIKERARKRVRNKALRKLASVSTQVLLGILLGAMCIPSVMINQVTELLTKGLKIPKKGLKDTKVELATGTTASSDSAQKGGLKHLAKEGYNFAMASDTAHQAAQKAFQFTTAAAIEVIAKPCNTD